MTDARFPHRWLTDRRVQKLSADAFRTFVHSLAWCASNRTDGVVEDEDVASIAHTQREHFDEMASKKLAQRQGRGWFLVDFPVTQTRERERRVDVAVKAQMISLALRSSRARAAKKASSP